jgi:hypothetical protein
VCRYLALFKRGKPERREVLEAAMSPNALRGLPRGAGGRRDMITNTINECVKMRLLEDNAGAVSIRPALIAGSNDMAQWFRRLPLLLSELFSSSENEENHNLAQVIAWYLAQETQRPPGTWQLMSRAIADQNVVELLGMNDARYSQFKDWICYLGFAWKHPKGSGELVMPDPTEQIRLRLPDLFAGVKNRTLPLGVAMDRLAAVAPVLEGGRFRNEVEKHLPKREKQHLSPSTALAWLRLFDEGLVQLHEEADAEMFVLPDGAVQRRFSRVTYISGSIGGTQ